MSEYPELLQNNRWIEKKLTKQWTRKWKFKREKNTNRYSFSLLSYIFYLQSFHILVSAYVINNSLHVYKIANVSLHETSHILIVYNTVCMSFIALLGILFMKIPESLKVRKISFVFCPWLLSKCVHISDMHPWNLRLAESVPYWLSFLRSSLGFENVNVPLDCFPKYFICTQYISSK